MVLAVAATFGYVRDANTGGGETGLVDGFAVAAALRAADPESFGVLTGTPVSFRYAINRRN
jgi:hypothetical protein